MNKMIFLSLIIAACSISLMAQESSEREDHDPSIMIGKWKVDLRPLPDAEPYYQFFEIDAVEGNSLAGRFYGSEITEGKTNLHWDKIYFAFQTSDGSNDYYHSGYIEDGVMHGTSYCPSRSFVAPWTAVKQ